MYRIDWRELDRNGNDLSWSTTIKDRAEAWSFFRRISKDDRCVATGITKLSEWESKIAAEYEALKAEALRHSVGDETQDSCADLYSTGIDCY